MGVLIAPFAVACFTFLIYLVLQGRYKERMAIIEKGLDVKDLNIGSISMWAALRAGMLMTGLELGHSSDL